MTVAAPRVSISEVSDNFVFSPRFLIVEQGDWVRWKSIAVGTTHSTTSGSGCVSNGLWNVSLMPNGQYTRLFMNAPSVLQYFCVHHCSFGMTGQVQVTTKIALTVFPSGTDALLTWTGGGGSYQVFRGDAPTLFGAGTSVLPPDGGNAGTTLVDPTVPAVGQALFYYVGNKI